MNDGFKIDRRSLLRLAGAGAAAGIAAPFAFEGVALGAEGGANASFTVGDPSGKLIGPMDFGYNTPFHFSGLFHGTLPESDPRSTRRQFAAALRRSGVQALRFPGGKPALLYLADGEQQTRDLTLDLKTLNPTNTKGGYQPNKWTHDYYVTIENFLSFCQEFGIEPIYQLNTAFYYDRDAQRTRAIVPTRYVVLPDGTMLSKYYDRNRVEEAAEALDRHIQWLNRRDLHVRYWEIGNEEMAEYDTGHDFLDGDDGEIANYAAVVTAFANVIRSRTHDSDITISGYQNWRGKPWDVPLLTKIREFGGIKAVDHVAIHYPFSQENNPSGPEQLLTEFVTTDMGTARNIANTQADLNDHGFGRITANVSETSAYRLPKWKGLDVTPTVAHGLVWGHNFGQLIYESSSNLNVKHDLESTFMGGLVYDCVLDPALDAKGKRNLHWIGTDGQFNKPLVTPPEQIPAQNWFRNEYFATPQIHVNSMLANAVGSRALTVAPGSLNQLVALFAAVDDSWHPGRGHHHHGGHDWDHRPGWGRGHGGGGDYHSNRSRMLLTIVNQSPNVQDVVAALPGYRARSHRELVPTATLAAGGEWRLEGVLPGEYVTERGHARVEQEQGHPVRVSTRVRGYSVTQVAVELES